MIDGSRQMMDGSRQYTHSRGRMLFANTLYVKSAFPSAPVLFMPRRYFQTVRYRTYMRRRLAILKFLSRRCGGVRIAASHQDGTR
jgi:hypothetical protein